MCYRLPNDSKYFFELLVSPKHMNATTYSVYGEELVDSLTPKTRPEEGKRRVLFIGKQKMNAYRTSARYG